MKTLKPVQPHARRPALKSAKSRPAWMGSGVGKAVVRAGVDLTKPSLPPGKYL